MAEQAIQTDSVEVMAMYVALQLTFSDQAAKVENRDQLREEYAKNYQTVKDASKATQPPPAKRRTSSATRGSGSENIIPASGGKRTFR